MEALRRIPTAIQQVIAKDIDQHCAFALLCSSLATSQTVRVPAALLRELPKTDSTPSLDHPRPVYDVLRVRQKNAFFLPEHLVRIADGLQGMEGIDAPKAKGVVESVQQAISTYLHDSSAREAEWEKDINLKFVSWPSSSSADCVDFVLYYITSFFPPTEWYTVGTEMGLLFDALREDPNLKTLQVDLRSRAVALQKANSVFEVLLVHPDDYLVTEGSRSNFLLVSPSNVLQCSLEKDILIGVTLKKAKVAAEKRGLGDVVHQRLTLKEVLEAKSILMLGTSPGVLPVRRILLYKGDADKQKFEHMVKRLALPDTLMKRIVKVSDVEAFIDYEVQNDTVKNLIEGYTAEALA